MRAQDGLILQELERREYELGQQLRALQRRDDLRTDDRREDARRSLERQDDLRAEDLRRDAAREAERRRAIESDERRALDRRR